MPRPWTPASSRSTPARRARRARLGRRRPWHAARRTPSELLTLVDARSGRVVDTARAGRDRRQHRGDDLSLYSGRVDLRATAGREHAPVVAHEDPRIAGSRTTDLKGATTGTGSDLVDADNALGQRQRPRPGERRCRRPLRRGRYLRRTTRTTSAATASPDDGKGALSRVHYGNAYENAFWQDSCFCMTYGDGDGTLRAAGVARRGRPRDEPRRHEPDGEPDLQPARAAVSTRPTATSSARWWSSREQRHGRPGRLQVGEELAAQPLRATWTTPSLDGAVTRLLEQVASGRLDVHYSSGVGNQFFFLLADGQRVGARATARRPATETVPGIGNEPRPRRSGTARSRRT